MSSSIASTAEYGDKGKVIDEAASSIAAGSWAWRPGSSSRSEAEASTSRGESSSASGASLKMMEHSPPLPSTPALQTRSRLNLFRSSEAESPSRPSPAAAAVKKGKFLEILNPAGRSRVEESPRVAVVSLEPEDGFFSTPKTYSRRRHSLGKEEKGMEEDENEPSSPPRDNENSPSSPGIAPLPEDDPGGAPTSIYDFSVDSDEESKRRQRAKRRISDAGGSSKAATRNAKKGSWEKSPLPETQVETSGGNRSRRGRKPQDSAAMRRSSATEAKKTAPSHPGMASLAGPSTFHRSGSGSKQEGREGEGSARVLSAEKTAEKSAEKSAKKSAKKTAEASASSIRNLLSRTEDSNPQGWSSGSAGTRRPKASSRKSSLAQKILPEDALKEAAAEFAKLDDFELEEEEVGEGEVE